MLEMKLHTSALGKCGAASKQTDSSQRAKVFRGGLCSLQGLHVRNVQALDTHLENPESLRKELQSAL